MEQTRFELIEELKILDRLMAEDEAKKNLPYKEHILEYWQNRRKGIIEELETVEFSWKKKGTFDWYVYAVQTYEDGGYAVASFGNYIVRRKAETAQEALEKVLRACPEDSKYHLPEDLQR